MTSHNASRPARPAPTILGWAISGFISLGANAVLRTLPHALSVDSVPLWRKTYALSVLAGLTAVFGAMGGVLVGLLDRLTIERHPRLAGAACCGFVGFMIAVATEHQGDQPWSNLSIVVLFIATGLFMGWLAVRLAR